MTADIQTLISREALAARVTELGRDLARVYGDAKAPPLVVGVLKGSSMFLADLVRAMNIDVAVDFMSISGYADNPSRAGVVRIMKDVDTSVAGRDVLIVEDIVDTGLTLAYLRRTLAARNPSSLRAVTLLDKSARRIVPVELEHRGFEIPDVFVIGYGLDFQAIYRNVPEILAVSDLTALAARPAMFVDRLFDAV